MPYLGMIYFSMIATVGRGIRAHSTGFPYGILSDSYWYLGYPVWAVSADPRLSARTRMSLTRSTMIL